MMSLPGIIIMLVVLSVFPQSLPAGMVTLGVLLAPFLARVVRSATLPVTEELYIAAARVSGLSRRYIIVRHILPRVAGPTIVQASLMAGVALIVQSGLGFLNLVVAAPAPSWGGMVADGFTVIVQQPWLIWPPGVLIATHRARVRDAGRRDRGSDDGKMVRVRTAHAPPPVEPRGRGAAPRPRALPADAGYRSVSSGVVREFRRGVGRRPRGRGRLASTWEQARRSGWSASPGAARRSTGHVDPRPAARSGHDRGGPDHLRRARPGRAAGVGAAADPRQEIALVSQEPMVSLTRSFRVGWQLTRGRAHAPGHARAPRRASGCVELLRSVHLPDPEVVARTLPARAVRRHGAAGRDRSRARRRAEAADRRRADDGARRHGAGRDPRAPARAPAPSGRWPMLLVTHDWGVVADVCDRASSCTPVTSSRAPTSSRSFREPLHPYTEALLASNPHDAPGQTRLPSIPGAVPKPGAVARGCHFQPRCRYSTQTCRERPVPLERPPRPARRRCIHYDQLLEAQ